MTNSKTNLKQIIIAGGALFVAIAAPIEASRFMGYDADVISVASAAEDGHAGQANAKGTKGGTGNKSGGMADQGSGGSGNKGASGQGSKSTEALLKGDGGSTAGSKSSTSAKGGPSADSDRPPTAGIKGGKSTSGGGKPGTSGSKKGDLFGDLFVLIRNPVTGVALTDAAGLPLVQAYDANGVLLPGVSVPRDAEGNLVLTGTLSDGTAYTYTTKEVEFGRLSVGRSPTKVLDHSLVEAVNKLIAADADPNDGVAIVLDASGRLAIATTTVVDGVTTTTVKAIDSPLENLALYKAIANLTGTDRTITVAVPASKDGTTAATTLTWTVPTTINIDLLKASLLAAAGDKTGTITLDTVMYINPIIGVTDDLSTFTYDRETTYKDLTVTVLIKQADGITYIATPVKVYDVVFNSTNDTTAIGAADFATAVDDALQVLEYVHDNAVK